ncbi:MAG: helix-turn-helix domain-containing protein, partial [Thiobacillaceae bacterium]
MSQAFTPGFGAKLAAARESRGMTVTEMAERLKLTPRQIEALEAEDWTGLPDPVFVRGFVRNYAKIVGVATEELMPAVDGAETVTQTITAPSAGVRLGSSPVARWLMLPLLLVILFVTVVVGLYTWLRQGEHALLPAETALPAEDAAAIPPVPPVGR